MRLSSVFVALVFAVGTFSFWALGNRPTHVPVWPEKIDGYAFSPLRLEHDALLNVLPTEAEIMEDVQLLSTEARELRTYSSLLSLNSIAQLADQHNLLVTQGIWLGLDSQINADEIAAGIELSNRYDNISRVMVGNEAVLRGDFDAAEMSAVLDAVKRQVNQPVSTAEPWHVWLRYPELVDHVDFVTVHMLPYWEGIHVDAAVDYIIDKMDQLHEAFPDKPVLIGEVGWPSDGRTRESAVASAANEAVFLRRFLAEAEARQYDYFLMEAFDQPWKAQSEGGVGAYWGVYDVNRQHKFSFSEPVVRVPDWQVLAFASILASLLMLSIFVLNSATLRTKGHGLIALVASVTATVLVWITYDYSQQYLTLSSVMVGILLMLCMLGVIVFLLTEAHEWAEAHWFTIRRRQIKPQALVMERAPKVSIHVPAYNEPAEMMIETLNALARLDYPDFEVIVVDNNTRDENVWRPVESHCALLGERFKFFHVAPLSGFKAGALNYALKQTCEEAAVIAAIDSDYQVEPNWLRDLVGAFDNPKIAIVQSPQDYRDSEGSAFKSMCFAEYRGFFEIGMITRNERNAIIQHGTMTLVRRSVLDELDGWGEWCITEDAELGLRIFEAGYEAMYLSYSYGQGLMPDTFIDYKKQRFRWAYGAMQILRRHTRELFSQDASALTNGQRYHFLAGWLPWIADGLSLVFNVAAIGWSVAMIIAPLKIDAPLVMFSVLPISLFVFKLSKMMYLYRSSVKANMRQTVAAAIAGLALSHTVGLATMKGMFTDNMPFVRTPKCANRSQARQALAAVRAELFMLVSLVSVVVVLLLLPREYGSPDLVMWSAAVLIQAIPYGAAVFVSFVSSFRWPAHILGAGITRRVYTPS